MLVHLIDRTFAYRLGIGLKERFPIENSKICLRLFAIVLESHPPKELDACNLVLNLLLLHIDGIIHLAYRHMFLARCRHASYSFGEVAEGPFRRIMGPDIRFHRVCDLLHHGCTVGVTLPIWLLRLLQPLPSCYSLGGNQ